MVAFLTPKRSRVDIVQATGRAMRKAKRKNTGYVLVPLFVEQAKGESLEEAVTRAEFDEVWNVLQAMQEQDEVLDDSIHFILAGGKGIKGFDESRIRERVEVIGPTISINTLRKAIATRCITRLGRPWDTMVQELLLFKRKFGHLRVPRNARPPWKELGVWMDNVRALERNRHLSAEREAQLNALGIEWRVDGQTLDDVTCLLNEDEFRKTSGLTNLAKYRNSELIKPVGKGMTLVGLSYFYHPKQIRELKKKLGITLDDTTGLLNENQFIPATGLTKVREYRKRGLVKPVGRAMTNHRVSYFYHPKQIKELKKRLGITLDNTTGLLNEKQFRKTPGLSQVRKYCQQGLIKPVGKAITNSGLGSYYHPRQIKELKKKLGITLDDTSGLLNEKQFAELSGLNQVYAYRKQGLIKPVGTAITNAGLSCYYHPRQAKELKKKLGITLDNTTGLLTEDQFRKESGLTPVAKYRQQGLIKPVGRALSTHLSYFYHPKQIKELKKKLGISLDDTSGLLNETQFGRASGVRAIARCRQQGLIKPLGRAMAGRSLSCFYHPSQIKTLKQKLTSLKKAKAAKRKQ
jgi:DNA-binding transcriptional MerR regulator